MPREPAGRRRLARLAGGPAPRSRARSGPRSTISRARISGVAQPTSARAWPAIAAPSSSSSCTAAGRPAGGACWRMAAALAERLAPAPPGCGRTRSIRRRKASASSSGSRSARCKFSISASSSASLVGELAHDDRHLVQPGALGRPPAPLAGDDLVAGRRRRGSHQERLQDAAARGSSAASASSSSSSKRRRGCSGDGRRNSIGTSRAAARRSRCAVSSALAAEQGRQAHAEPAAARARSCPSVTPRQPALAAQHLAGEMT